MDIVKALEKKHVGHKLECCFKTVSVDYWNGYFFHFGLFYALTFIVGVALDIEVNKFLDLLHFSFERIFSCYHLFLSVSGHNFTLLDLLLGVENLVKSLLLVAECLALCVEEDVVCGGVVEGECLFLLLLVFLLVCWGGHYLKWGD